MKGADITVKAGDTLTNYAAQIDGTGTVLQIAGNSALNYTATQSRSAKDDTKSSTSFMGMAEVGHDNSTTTSINSQELGTKIFGKEIGIKAKDVVIKGAEVVAKELVQIDATDSVTITAATNTSSTRHTEDKSMMGISANIGSGVSLNSSASTLNATQSATSSSASTISGANVTIKSGGDTTIQASNVIADKDVSVTAGGNINILAAKNTETSASQSTSSATSIGLVGGVSPRQTLFSNTNTAGNGQGTSTTSTTSVLSANGGNLTLAAKNGTVTVQGAELLAQDKVSITAQDVDLQAITDRSTSSNHFESHSITVGAALSGTVGSKITAISDNLQLASNTSNERLKGAATLKAGYDAYKLVSGGAAEGIASQSTTKDGDPSGSAFGVSVSVGINSSKQDNSSAASQSRGTSIQAKDIDITATGGPGSTAGGNITAVGAKLQGENISLDAAKDINLMAAVNTNNLKSSNESHSLGGGVTFGVGQQNGFSFQFNAGQANGNTDGVELGYDNTLVTATKNLSVKSGGNTNLVGAQLAGDKVKMNVGGDLNIVTLQDTSKFDSEQHSSGIAVSLCIPPLCVGNVASGSINKSDSTIAHNYQSATGQSGIAAGSGGYDITVKGNTDLVGGAITSTAAKDKNTLSTGSLTSSDLNNTQNTNSQSSSISLSYSGSSSAMGNLANNVSANLLGNLGAGAGLPANGSQSGVTQSVISPGNVTITGTGDITKEANSNAQVATLTGRDASKANGSLINTLTLQQAQEIPAQQQRAAENAQAANLAGAAMDGMIGDMGYPTGSPQATILHGFSGLIQASIGGTNAASGFISGAVNEQAVGTMADYLESKGIKRYLNGNPNTPNPEFNELMKAGSTLLGAGTTAALGGTRADAAAGGNIAKNGTEFNALVHDQRRAVVNSVTKGMTPQQKQIHDDAACALANCAAGLDPNDPATETQIRSQFRGSANTSEAATARGALLAGGYEPATAWENLKDGTKTVIYYLGEESSAAGRGAQNVGNMILNDFKLALRNSNGPQLPDDFGRSDGPNTGGGAAAVVTTGWLLLCAPPAGPCVVTPPLVGITTTSPLPSGWTLSQNNSGDGQSAAPSNSNGANGGVVAGAETATSSVNGAKLNNQLTSQAINDGHAFGKHIAEFSDLGIKTEAQFQSHVESVINNATNKGPLNNGRTYFYDSNSNTIVIKNPNAVDGGTAFRIDTTRYPNPLDYIKTLR